MSGIYIVHRRFVDARAWGVQGSERMLAEFTYIFMVWPTEVVTFSLKLTATVEQADEAIAYTSMHELQRL